MIMGDLLNYIKYHLKKRWKRRTPVIATYVFGVTNMFQLQLISSITERLFLFMIATTLMIMVDEWVKEGHFFDPLDIGGLTHETLVLVFMPLLIPVALYLRRRIIEMNKALSAAMENLGRELSERDWRRYLSK